MSTQYKKLFAACFIVVVIGLLIGRLFLPSAGLARPDLPPRHPTASPTSDDDDDGGRVRVGAYIELQTAGFPTGAWSVVQWIDTAGTWHDVEGWTAAMPSTQQRHWVAPHDFGKGPFRWQVRRGPTGPVLATSESFSLPLSGNEVVVVTAGDK